MSKPTWWPYIVIYYQFVDDVEFWFPPGKKSVVQYRSASRLGNFDFDINKKRIKASIRHLLFDNLTYLYFCDGKLKAYLFCQALRVELEKKGWSSEDSFWCCFDCQEKSSRTVKTQQNIYHSQPLLNLSCLLEILQFSCTVMNILRSYLSLYLICSKYISIRLALWMNLQCVTQHCFVQNPLSN